MTNECSCSRYNKLKNESWQPRQNEAGFNWQITYVFDSFIPNSDLKGFNKPPLSQREHSRWKVASANSVLYHIKSDGVEWPTKLPLVQTENSLIKLVVSSFLMALHQAQRPRQHTSKRTKRSTQYDCTAQCTATPSTPGYHALQSDWVTMALDDNARSILTTWDHTRHSHRMSRGRQSTIDCRPRHIRDNRTCITYNISRMLEVLNLMFVTVLSITFKPIRSGEAVQMFIHYRYS